MRLSKRGVAKATIVITVLFVAMALGANIVGDQLVAPVPVVPPVPALVQDASLVAYARTLGIDYTPLNINFSAVVTSTDVKGETIASFTAPNSILIKSGMSEEKTSQALAYEYMHYTWSLLTPVQRTEGAVGYQTLWNNNYEFQRLTSGYYGSPEIIADERNSTACVLMQPSVLSADFNAYCNSYIKNRGILF